MGMYTELALGVELKPTTPKDVIDTLERMATATDRREAWSPPESIAAHPLFQTERWPWMLRSGGSAYFDALPVVKWQRHKGVDGGAYLTFWTNIKNYGNEWLHFLDFLNPHVESRGHVESRWHVGHCRYEEDEHPTLIYATDRGLVLVRVSPAIQIYKEEPIG